MTSAYNQLEKMQIFAIRVSAWGRYLVLDWAQQKALTIHAEPEEIQEYNTVKKWWDSIDWNHQENVKRIAWNLSENIDDIETSLGNELANGSIPPVAQALTISACRVSCWALMNHLMFVDMKFPASMTPEKTAKLKELNAWWQNLGAENQERTIEIAKEMAVKVHNQEDVWLKETRGVHTPLEKGS